LLQIINLRERRIGVGDMETKLLQLDPPRAGNLALFVSLFLLGTFPSAALLYAPALANELVRTRHLDPRHVGMFFSVEFCGYAVAGFLGAYVLARARMSSIMRVSLTMFIIGNILSIAASGNYTWLLLTRGATAILGGCTLTMIGITACGRSDNPSRANGVFLLGQIVSGVIGLAVFPRLFQTYGLSAFFVAEAVAGVLAFLIVPFLPNEAPGTVSMSSGGTATRGDFLRGLAMITLLYVSFSGVWTFAGAIGRSLGVPGTHIGAILSLSAGAGVLGASVATITGKRFRLIVTTSTGLALLIASIAGLGVAPGVVVFIVSAMLFKFAWTYMLPPAFSLIAAKEKSGRLVTFSSAGIGVGLVIGPSLSGWLIQAFNGYPVALTVAAAFLVVVWMIALVMNRSSNGQSSPA
jgi:DHA1 family inner membrane transport protein